MSISLEEFMKWERTPTIIKGRCVRFSSEWGDGVWWSERFNGVVGPIPAVVGVLGYENDPPDPRAERV